MARQWTCQRVIKGVKCGTVNPARRKLCTVCGKARPVRKRPAHSAVLRDVPYEKWVEIFGETCGICGRKPSANRRLDRDHDHKTGMPRGLLCARCNRALPGHITVQWLYAAIRYLERIPRMFK